MIGKNVEADKERQLAGYWIGIEILDRLANAGDRLTSAEVAALLGVKNVKGIGRALSQTRESLALSGIRFEDTRVPGAIGTGRNPSMLAWIGNARWVERRIALVDAVEQVEAVRAGRVFLDEQGRDGWRNVDADRRYRHVRWIGGLRDGLAPRRTPPLRMRLRCWYEIVVSNAKGERTVLREEGLRGDTARTTDRALDRWRSTRAKNSSELLLVNEVRIAKRQPRPMPPE